MLSIYEQFVNNHNELQNKKSSVVIAPKNKILPNSLASRIRSQRNHNTLHDIIKDIMRVNSNFTNRFKPKSDKNYGLKPLK